MSELFLRSNINQNHPQSWCYTPEKVSQDAAEQAAQQTPGGNRQDADILNIQNSNPPNLDDMDTQNIPGLLERVPPAPT